MKQKFNHDQKNPEKHKNTWRLDNKLPNNKWVNNDIKEGLQAKIEA